MQRVLIVGCAGAGKSTLARRLGEMTGLPVVHLDQEFWLPGWVRPDPVVWRTRVGELAAGRQWILDGNYGTAQELALPQADTVIWLDVARWRCIGRVLWRSFWSYGQVRDDAAPGCPERFEREFWRYIWDFNRIDRPNIERRLKLHGGHLAPVILRRNRDVTRFLASVTKTYPTGGER